MPGLRFIESLIVDVFHCNSHKLNDWHIDHLDVITTMFTIVHHPQRVHQHGRAAHVCQKNHNRRLVEIHLVHRDVRSDRKTNGTVVVDSRGVDCRVLRLRLIFVTNAALPPYTIPIDRLEGEARSVFNACIWSKRAHVRPRIIIALKTLTGLWTQRRHNRVTYHRHVIWVGLFTIPL